MVIVMSCDFKGVSVFSDIFRKHLLPGLLPLSLSFWKAKSDALAKSASGRI
jgi:hypothetical protein